MRIFLRGSLWVDPSRIFLNFGIYFAWKATFQNATNLARIREPLAVGRRRYFPGSVNHLSHIASPNCIDDVCQLRCLDSANDESPNEPLPVPSLRHPGRQKLEGVSGTFLLGWI